MASRVPISILSLSQNRSVVRLIGDYIHSYGYTIGGILEASPFSTSDLALALRLLEPRPQVVLVGKGYSEDVTDQVRDVFSQYAREVGTKDGAVIKISAKVFDEVGKDGIPKWVLGQLQSSFGQ
ncbi:hypothetical protein B0I35DRAFT_482026 [Stachybotrys elegans]|uniref:Uncharacterized protein n=1 Tax=Stachybotrys elegans TaxID=80388 RepID=A0A8K0SNQ0_9HYPO|nr:hypothetical protein B0I35DRAFT_482026 [Stachybotrys elegans]